MCERCGSYQRQEERYQYLDQIRKEKQKVIPKKEIESRGGFKMELYRWAPEAPRKGGLGIYAIGSELERFFIDGRSNPGLENPRDLNPAFVEAPLLYKIGNRPVTEGWDTSPISAPDGMTYQPDFRLGTDLLNPETGTINMSFLRAKGLSNGVIFKIEGLCPVDDMKIYRLILSQYVARIHDAYFKKVRVQIEVPIPEQFAR